MAQRAVACRRVCQDRIRGFGVSANADDPGDTAVHVVVEAAVWVGVRVIWVVPSPLTSLHSPDELLFVHVFGLSGTAVPELTEAIVTHGPHAVCIIRTRSIRTACGTAVVIFTNH